MARNGRAQELSVFVLLAGVGHVLCQPKYVETGTNYTFSPNVNTGVESVLWKFRNDKVVEYEYGNLRWFQFKEQGEFDEKSGNLKLNGLKKSQSGLYECEITVPGNFQVLQYNIKVIDAVKEPQVKCIKNSEGRATSLECFLQPDVEGATFTWTGPGSKKTTGKTLQITNETMKDTVLFCTVENPLGKKDKEYSLKDCNPERKDNAGVVAGVVSLLVILLLLGIGVAGYFWWKKRTGAEYTRTSQTIEEAVCLQEDKSNSNDCQKDDGKGQEGSNNVGHGSNEKLNAKLEDVDESPKKDAVLPNTVNLNEELNDEKAEEDQEGPVSAEKLQGAASTDQETLTEDKNNMAQSNEDADLDEGPTTFIDFNEKSSEENAKGQNQHQVTPVSVASNADADLDEGPTTFIDFNEKSSEENAKGQNQHQVTPVSVASNAGNEDSGS